MTVEETACCLEILRTNYPASFPKKTSQTDAQNLIFLWSSLFHDDPYEIVLSAIMDLMTTKSEWAPDIAAVKQRMREMAEAVSDEPTEQDLWAILCKAVSNSAYGAREEYEKLPPELQRFAGSPGGLRSLAALDADTFQSVTRGQFFKQIESIRSRQEMNKRITPRLADMIRALTERSALPAEKDPNDPETVNSRRNLLLGELG